MSCKCPVCKTEITTAGDQRVVPEGIEYKYPCQRCGDFWLRDDFGAGALRGVLQDDLQKIATLSHWIRTTHKARGRAGGFPIVLTEKLVNDIIKNPRPSLTEQVDNFVRWIGDEVKVGGECIDLPSDVLGVQAIVGAATTKEFMLVLEHVRERRLIDSTGGGGPVWMHVTLSFAGWERYQELKRATSDSRKAFMAMQYNEPELDTIVGNWFRKAVKQTGFELFILPDRPKAGLIDDRLRVEIRMSRFLIADLTHQNRGAYWEAGYAEGLGKHVIYTCEKRKFKRAKTHFDTNHHETVLWDPQKPQEAAERLKDTIRATFPEEAKSTDD